MSISRRPRCNSYPMSRRAVGWVALVAAAATGFSASPQGLAIPSRRGALTKMAPLPTATTTAPLALPSRRRTRGACGRRRVGAAAGTRDKDDDSADDAPSGSSEEAMEVAAAEAAAAAASATAEENVARAEVATAAVAALASDDDDPLAGLGPFGKAKARFLADRKEHLLIPVIAACVGWITNKLAVEMIFYPLYWKGIPIRRFPGSPFGLIGWQGIVPTKAAMMSARIVDMVTSKLINVQEVFYQLNPTTVAQIMTPEVDAMAGGIASEALPQSLARVAKQMVKGLPAEQLRQLREIQKVRGPKRPRPPRPALVRPPEPPSPCPSTARR